MMAQTVPRERVIRGYSAFPGFVSGNMAVLPGRKKGPGSEKLAASELIKEKERLHKAIDNAIKNLNELVSEVTNTVQSQSHEAIDVLSVHHETLKDPLLINDIEQYIERKQVNAPRAVYRVVEKYIRKLERSGIQTWQEKINDLVDYRTLLLKNLGFIETLNIPEQADILYTEQLSPQQVLELRALGIKGLVLKSSSSMSHDVILIRALQIPAVYGIDMNLDKTSKTLYSTALNASAGIVHLYPHPETMARFKRMQKVLTKRYNRPEPDNKPAKLTTQCGKPVSVYTNLELTEELSGLDTTETDGVGLFRTEFLLLTRSLPSITTQVNTYKKVLKAFKGKTVTLRLFDLGGDKFFFPGTTAAKKKKEGQLGHRSIRFLLENRRLLHEQLRAMVKAQIPETKLRIMIPMVSVIEEFELVEEMLKDICLQEKAAEPELGIMIETPAAIDLLPWFNKKADFFSVGTNDLLQYLTAADRNDLNLRHIYHPLHESLFRALERIRGAIDPAKDISICGEMVSEPYYLALLPALGYYSYSVAPYFLHEARRIIQSITYSKSQTMLTETRKRYDLVGRFYTLEQIFSETMPSLPDVL